MSLLHSDLLPLVNQCCSVNVLSASQLNFELLPSCAPRGLLSLLQKFWQLLFILIDHYQFSPFFHTDFFFFSFFLSVVKEARTGAKVCHASVFAINSIHLQPLCIWFRVAGVALCIYYELVCLCVDVKGLKPL